VLPPCDADKIPLLECVFWELLPREYMVHDFSFPVLAKALGNLRLIAITLQYVGSHPDPSLIFVKVHAIKATPIG